MSIEAVANNQSTATAATTAATADLRAPARRRTPKHFFVGTVLLYALVLGTFLLTATRLRHAEPNWRTLVPFAAAVSFYVAANLFLLILGRGHVSRWTVLKCVAATLVMTTTFCVLLRARLLVNQLPDDAATMRHVLLATDAHVRALLEAPTWLARSARFAGMLVMEELIKLTPVLVLVWRGRIRNAQGAMLCGVLSGLSFGCVEGISYGYLVYPVAQEPVTTYLTRFFIMSPLHGIWDALAGGLIFFLAGHARSNTARGPTFGSAAAAFACAVVFHVTHNALQAILGPMMQIATVFALLAPLYLMAKHARKRAAAEGSPDGGQLVGDLHLLTFCLSVGFLAISLLFSWVLGIPRA